MATIWINFNFQEMVEEDSSIPAVVGQTYQELQHSDLLLSQAHLSYHPWEHQFLSSGNANVISYETKIIFGGFISRMALSGLDVKLSIGGK